MSGKANIAAANTDPLIGPVARAADSEIKPVAPVQPAESTGDSDLRLIIEETDEAGHYVYTIVDRRTGRVVSRLARDEVLRQREKSDYAAGDVFDVKA